METVKPIAVVVSKTAAERSETRRDWALLALFGGAIVMTIFAAACLWMVRENARYVLFLGLAAQIQVLMVLTAFAGLLVKRSLKISKSEVSIVDQSDDDPQDTDVVRRGDVKQEIEEAVEEVPAINVPTERKDGDSDQSSGRNQ